MTSPGLGHIGENLRRIVPPVLKLQNPTCLRFAFQLLDTLGQRFHEPGLWHLHGNKVKPGVGGEGTALGGCL